jgi:ubiquinone/menaquinone biosynthesis C-methylase UbiE
MLNKIQKIIKNLYYRYGDLRVDENKFINKFINESDEILDVGCGTGLLLADLMLNKKVLSQGIDLNQKNVDYCQQRGLKVKVGSAFDIEFNNERFDVVVASHLLHALTVEQAVKFFGEALRVLKPEGKLIISTHNIHKRFFKHPENVRPYPPDALFRLFGIGSKRAGSTSPMFDDFPAMRFYKIWLRHPPLINFYSSTNLFVTKICLLLNMIQYRLYIRNYLSYESYIIIFQKAKSR